MRPFSKGSRSGARRPSIHMSHSFPPPEPFDDASEAQKGGTPDNSVFQRRALLGLVGHVAELLQVASGVALEALGEDGEDIYEVCKSCADQLRMVK